MADSQKWILKSEAAGRSLVQHVAIVLRLEGPLDRPALRAALDEITARHEGMRAVLRERRTGYVLAICPEDCGFTLLCQEVVDDAHVERLRRAELDMPFDLMAGPAVRGRLLRLSDENHVVLITLHCVVFDLPLSVVLLQELVSLYGNLACGRRDALAHPRDNSAGVDPFAKGNFKENLQLDFWRSVLLSVHEVMSLPVDRHPTTRCELTDHLPLTVEPTVLTQLQQLARRSNVTLFAVLLGSWALLLGRWTAEQRVLVGAWLPSRRWTEFAPFDGRFENIVALPIDLDAGASVEEFIRKVEMLIGVAQENSDVRFEQILDRLHAVHGHNLDLQVLMRFDDATFWNSVAAELELSCLHLKNATIGYGRVRAQLLLSLTRSGGTVGGALQYAGELFTLETIERLAESWRLILEGMVADSQQTISCVPILRANPVTSEIVSSASDCLQERLVHELIEEHADAIPVDVAVVVGGERLDYQELNERANQLAHYLIEQGVEADDLVAVCLPRGVDLVVTLLAILKVGSAYLVLDLKDGERWIDYVLSDSTPSAVLTNGQHKAFLPTIGARIVDLDLVAEIVRSKQRTNVRAENTSPRSLACLTYTADPERGLVGVMTEHRNVSRCLAAIDECLHFNRMDGWLSMHSAARHFSILELWGPLAHGSRLILAPEKIGLSADAFSSLVSREHVAAAVMTWDEIQTLLLGPTSFARKGSLHTVVLLDEVHSQPGTGKSFETPLGLWPRIVRMYGTAEMTSFVAYHSIRQRRTSVDNDHAGYCALSHSHLHVLDKHCKQVPIGAFGEVHVGGAGIARGYLHKDELNAERFRPDPFDPHGEAALYKTGLRGRWRQDGTLELSAQFESTATLERSRFESQWRIFD